MALKIIEQTAMIPSRFTPLEMKDNKGYRFIVVNKYWILNCKIVTLLSNEMNPEPSKIGKDLNQRGCYQDTPIIR